VRITWLKWLLVALVGAYASAVALLYAFQTPLLYRNSSEYTSPAQMKLEGVREFLITTEDRMSLKAWYAAAEPGKPVILHLHGKGGNMASRASRWRYYRQKGFGVLFFDYRGFGGSTGEPSEEGLKADAHAAYDWLISNNIRPSEIVLSSESMGTGFAVMLAAERPVAALSLMSAYSSIADIAADRHWWAPVRSLIKDEIDAAAIIPKVTAPILVQHGDADQTIPVKFGQLLFERANQPKQFILLEGRGHYFTEAEFETELQFFMSHVTPD
jgi:uncharacterized protein